jgi:glycosyltransferase involved in cell wall biosynthesis
MIQRRIDRMESRVTILCCYNDKKQLDCFLESLQKQDEKFELLLIDNRKNKYNSCSEAFNKNLEKIKTEFVVFSHQDIVLTKPDQLRRFVDYLTAMGEDDILGVAGGKRGEKYTITNICHGASNKKAGGKQLEGIAEVDVIDECFFGGSTKCFLNYPFDEKLCPGWHMYAVERSLAALVRGDHVYVCDIELEHRSKGKINHAYNVDFYNVSKRYEKKIDYLKTTCAYAKTRFPSREWAYLKREVSILLGRY